MRPQFYTSSSTSMITKLSRKLDQNQKAIAQCYMMISSYICEPQTYAQFEELSALKETAKGLKVSNEQLILDLKSEKQDAVTFELLTQKHLQEFYDFSLDAAVYIKTMKHQRVAV